MFAVTGITGNVGGEVARNLLAAGQRVRGVVRETRKGETWAARGCDLVEADINDAAALTAAFNGFNEGWIEFESGGSGSQKWKSRAANRPSTAHRTRN